MVATRTVTRGVLAGSWLLAVLAIALSLRTIGLPVLEMRYGPDLVIVGMKTDGWQNAQLPGDSIIAIDGNPVATAADIRRFLMAAKSDGRHVVGVQRDGKTVSLSVRAYRLTWWGWVGDNLALLIYGLAYLVAGSLLIVRQARGPVVEAFVGLCLSCGLYAVVGVDYLTSHALWPVVVVLQPANALSFLAFGLALRHPQRRVRWPWVLTAVGGVVLLAMYPPHGLQAATDPAWFHRHHVLQTTGLWGISLAALLCLWVLMVLALRHSERFSVHRQQVKIILAGTLVSMTPVCGVWFVALLRGQQPYEPVAALALVAIAIMPLTCAAALLRVRLVELERLIRLTLIYSLAAGGLGATYFGLYGLFAILGAERVAIASEQQFGLLVVMAILFEPTARGVGRVLDRFLYGDRWGVTELLTRIQGYGALSWSQDSLLTQIAQDVGDAAQLQAVAVALPDEGGWRIAAGTEAYDGLGRLLGGPLPNGPAFWASEQTDLAGFRAAIRLTLAERPVSLLLLGDRRDGVPLSEIDLRYVSLFLAPLSGMIGYAHSRERQRQAETAIAQLYDQIAHVNLAVLNQSATVWGHDELTVPLRLIVAQAGQLLAGDFGKLDSVQQRRIELIHRHAQRLGRAIADTDDLQALLSGTATIQRQPVDVWAVMQHAWSQVRPQAEIKALRLVIPDGDDVYLLSDISRLERVIEHLFDNAVTHSPVGGAVVCRWTQAGPTLTLTMTDQGPGIPPERLYVLQALSTTLQDPDRHRQGHLGIGLALVHATLHRLGGTLQIESGAQGTTVTLALPLESPEMVTSSPTS